MNGDIGPYIAAVVLGLPAAAYAALRVIRRDRTEDSAIGVVERSLKLVEQDRDHWRDQYSQLEDRMNSRLKELAEHSKSEREALYRQIETLRRELHALMLRNKENP